MKRPHQRQFLHLAASAAALPALPHTARAQNYPTRQITLIAPWPAGGAIDALCRAMAPGLAAHLGTSVIVENRPGASSVLGVATGARAAPDGYTLTMAGSASLAISVTLNRKLPYDPLKSFVPIAFTGSFLSFWWRTRHCRSLAHGPDQVRQGQSGQAVICLRGVRLAPSSARGIAQEHGGH